MPRPGDKQRFGHINTLLIQVYEVNIDIDKDIIHFNVNASFREYAGIFPCKNVQSNIIAGTEVKTRPHALCRPPIDRLRRRWEH
jgi:hypothetical protein